MITAADLHFTLAVIGHRHAGPPASFVIDLVNWAKGEADFVFEPDPNYDIYSMLGPKLGPWTSLLQRRAAMCEALRCLAGDESDWNWNEGRDTTAGPETEDEMEAGAFQVSYNSSRLDPELASFLGARGIANAADFRARLKADPALDMAYTARLLRAQYRHWDGPINEGWVQSQVSLAAMLEFERLLSAA